MLQRGRDRVTRRPEVIAQRRPQPGHQGRLLGRGRRHRCAFIPAGLARWTVGQQEVGNPKVNREDDAGDSKRHLHGPAPQLCEDQWSRHHAEGAKRPHPCGSPGQLTLGPCRVLCDVHLPRTRGTEGERAWVGGAHNPSAREWVPSAWVCTSN